MIANKNPRLKKVKESIYRNLVFIELVVLYLYILSPKIVLATTLEGQLDRIGGLKHQFYQVS